MSQSFAFPPISGTDLGALADRDAPRHSGASDTRTWFDSDMMASGSIALPATPGGQGSQDLDHLVDNIVAPLQV